jgi:hypothetical protein
MVTMFNNSEQVPTMLPNNQENSHIYFSIVAQLILGLSGEISTYWAASLGQKASRSYFIVGIAATTKGSNPLCVCSI